MNLCLHVNATNLDQDLDQNPHVNRAIVARSTHMYIYSRIYINVIDLMVSLKKKIFLEKIIH